MAEMRTSYGELVTSWWQFVGNLRTICGITFQPIALNYQQSLKLRKAAPTSADFLPHFWHRSGTNVAKSWRLKMSSKVLPKNRVMCLQIFSVGFGEAASPIWEVKKTCGKILAYCAVKTKAFWWAASLARQNFWRFWREQASNKCTRASVYL